MIAGVIGLLAVAALVALVTGLKRPSSLRPAARFVVRQGGPLALRLPVALVAAGFLGLLVPPGNWWPAASGRRRACAAFSSRP